MVWSDPTGRMSKISMAQSKIRETINIMHEKLLNVNHKSISSQMYIEIKAIYFRVKTSTNDKFYNNSSIMNLFPPMAVLCIKSGMRHLRIVSYVFLVAYYMSSRVFWSASFSPLQVFNCFARSFDQITWSFSPRIWATARAAASGEVTVVQPKPAKTKYLLSAIITGIFILL